MDHSNVQYEYSSKDDLEKVELLEDSWFFGNLLGRNSRMLRSLSDPCPSSNYNNNNQEKSYEETYELIDKLSDGTNRHSLIKAPSAPCSFERRDQKTAATTIIKETDTHRGKRSNRNKALSKSLIRAPSLPTSLETQEFQDEEIEFSMGKLIRQASMKNNPDTLPPRTQSTKGSTLTRSCSISRYRSRRNHDLECIKTKDFEEIKPQRQMNLLKTQTSLIEFESEQLQGFKDMGFDFDEKELNPDVINTTPGLQEDEERSTIRRPPYLFDAWGGSRSYSAPPVPKWSGKRSTEDLKAQIKFWARAVASNVRQEC